MALESQLLDKNQFTFSTSTVTVKIPHISFGVSRIIVNSVLFSAHMYMYKCLENRNFQLGGVILG